MSIFTAPRIPHGPSRLHLLEGAIGVFAAGALVIAGVAWFVDGSSTTTSPTAPVVTAAPRSFGASLPAARTYYVVTTQAMADTVAVAIEANRIRSASGETPFNDSVVLVASDAEAASFEAAIFEGNRILAGMGQVEDRVVRLGPGGDAAAPHASRALPATDALSDAVAMPNAEIAAFLAVTGTAFPTVSVSAPSRWTDTLGHGIAMPNDEIAAFLALNGAAFRTVSVSAPSRWTNTLGHGIAMPNDEIAAFLALGN